ncbi:MAG TPA: hypothetical protein VN754_11665 [Candidatus Binataceae bacterium]|nr:hypothetical protein [Candidatus Binataceae bacterium]
MPSTTVSQRRRFRIIDDPHPSEISRFNEVFVKNREVRSLQSPKAGEARTAGVVFKCIVDGLAAHKDIALARV